MIIYSRFYTFVLCAFLWLVLPPSPAPAANWAASMVPLGGVLDASTPRPTLILSPEFFADKEEYFGIVRFDAGSSKFTRTARLRLDKQVKVLKKRYCMIVVIKGFADRFEAPNVDESIRLGERRALAVRNYLISKGIAAYRILRISFGWHFAPNRIDLNNRSTITNERIVKNEKDPRCKNRL